METTSLISIIVPCYNQAQYLDECLQSVMEQTCQNWECIIVNDGSPDNTEEIAKKWIEKDNRFAYFFQTNKGISNTRNTGINIAKGMYILPLDADDKISNNYLEACLNIFENNPKTKLVYGNAIKFGKVNENWKLNSYNYHNLLHSNMIFCTAMYKKESWQLAGGYDEKMQQGFEDWEFWIQMLKKEDVVIHTKKCNFYYRIKESSRTTNLNDNENFKKELQAYIYTKHRNKYTNLSEYELYHQSYILNEQIKNPYKYYTYKALLKALIKKIYHKFYK